MLRRVPRVWVRVRSGSGPGLVSRSPSTNNRNPDPKPQTQHPTPSLCLTQHLTPSLCLTQAMQRGQSDFAGEAIDEMMKVRHGALSLAPKCVLCTCWVYIRCYVRNHAPARTSTSPVYVLTHSRTCLPGDERVWAQGRHFCLRRVRKGAGCSLGGH